MLGSGYKLQVSSYTLPETCNLYLKSFPIYQVHPNENNTQAPHLH